MTTPRKTAGPPGRRATPKKKPAKGRHTAAEFEALITKALLKQRYILKLYVTGTSPRSAEAIASIRALCDEHLLGRYDLEVIDIYQQPDEARRAQIIAAPTLVKEAPAPLRRMIGDLANRTRLLIGLDLKAVPAGQKTDVEWLTL